MPELVQITTYAFEELSDTAKAQARDWYRQGAFDYPWYDFVYEDFETICDLMGLTLRTTRCALMGGGTRQKPCIYFRGFWSQGDGACFEGVYAYRTGTLSEVRAHAPQDAELHRIASGLCDIQRRNFYQLRASIGHRGRYCHEYSMAIDVDRDSPTLQAATDDAEEAVKQGLRDLSRWLYRQLERDYEYINSDGAIEDAIAINGYRFREDGAFYG